MAAASKAKAVLKLKPQRDLLLQVLASLVKPEFLEVLETATLESPATISVANEAVKGETAIAEYLGSLWNGISSGETSVAKAEIHDALISAKTIAPKDPESWASLSSSLSGKTFYVGNALSLADVAVYSALYIPFSRLSLPERGTYYHVTRYMDLIQHLVRDALVKDKVPVTRVLEIDVTAPVVIEAPAPVKVKKAAEDTKKEDPKKSMKPAAASTTKDKDPKKAEKKEDAKPSGPHPSQLDIRVGKVLSVNRHPDAESLYVEEVDLGEPTPRTVVSGLVKFMPPESIKDHLIVLLCNLKPAKMRGVESQAMVLTAESQDGVKVELLAPPAGSKPGDKVYFEGFGKGTPEAVLTPKKKIWEGIQVALKTDDNCRPVFCGADGKACALMTEKGECRAKTIKGGRIK